MLIMIMKIIYFQIYELLQASNIKLLRNISFNLVKKNMIKLFQKKNIYSKLFKKKEKSLAIPNFEKMGLSCSNLTIKGIKGNIKDNYNTNIEIINIEVKAIALPLLDGKEYF